MARYCLVSSCRLRHAGRRRRHFRRSYTFLNSAGCHGFTDLPAAFSTKRRNNIIIWSPDIINMPLFRHKLITQVYNAASGRWANFRRYTSESNYAYFHWCHASSSYFATSPPRLCINFEAFSSAFGEDFHIFIEVDSAAPPQRAMASSHAPPPFELRWSWRKRCCCCFQLAWVYDASITHWL